jgi:hypothetical protein
VTPEDFQITSNQRFADNELMRIRPAHFRAFADDIRATFVAQVAPNVPEYDPNYFYPADYLVVFAGQFFRTKLEGFLPEPTPGQETDAWLPALMPLSPMLPYREMSVQQGQDFASDGLLEPSVLYRFTGRLDADGITLDDVLVEAVSRHSVAGADAYAIGIDPQTREEYLLAVSYELATDTTSPRAAGYTKEEAAALFGTLTTQQQHELQLGQLFGLRDSRIVVKAASGAVSAWTTMPTTLEPGSVVTVHGAPYFPSLDYQFPASGTLVLAPGSTLTLKNLRPPSGSLLLCGEGTLNAPVNIGPAAQQVTIRDIQLNGYLYAFSYNIFGATRKLRLYNVRLTNTDASQAAAVTVDYGYAQNYYTYLQAEIIGCDITSAGDAIKFFDQFPGAAAGDAQAKATNSLLLLQNRIKVGSGKRVLNDDAGALSFVRGGNLYVAASVPAQAYAVVVGTDGGGTGSGQPAPSAGPALGTGTVVTFKVDTEYPELFSGSYTFDPTGAVLGVVVRARLGANATQPVVPSSFVLLAGAYAAGARHLYSFCVAPGGVIEYYITRLP